MGLGFKERLPRKEESMQTRPDMGFGYKEELLRIGRNCSEDVLSWAWARKSDSFERGESLQRRPAMDLGYEEQVL